MPAWSAFDPIELRPWLGHLNLLDVIDHGRDFRYRVHGTRIGETYRTEMTGRLVSDWPESARDRAFRTYRRAVTLAKPHLVNEHEFLNGHPRLHTRLVLPLAQDYQTVDKLLVYLAIGDRSPEETAAEYQILD